MWGAHCLPACVPARSRVGGPESFRGSRTFGPLLEISCGAFSPICSMQNKNDQPKNERECSGWQRDEHEPPHHAQSIKQLAVIFSIDHARMHRAFIDAAAVCVSD